VDDAAFQQRFDIARMVLERKYRWAKPVLRQLQPVQRAKGTMAVDQYMRLYHGPDADAFTDQEFLGALWHEVNHVLRHHGDRLGHLAKRDKMDPRFVNLAADLEINDDLREQGITLPGNVFYSDSDSIQQVVGVSAEEHFAEFVRKQAEQPKMRAPQQDPDDSDPDDEEQDDSFDPNAQQFETPGPSGSNDDGDEDEDWDDEGDGDGSDGGDSDGDEDADGDAPGSNGPDLDEIEDCGSGSDGQDKDWEEPEPDASEQAKVDKAQQKQDEEVLKAVEEEGGLPPGMSQEVYDAAVERQGVTEVDWKQRIGVEIRNAMEQRADEAEEYTFRRRSRRAGALEDLIIPGSYRPIPVLGTVVDISGSMDAAKVTATFRELVGILERLAIPSFTAYAWNTHLRGDPITVSTESDVQKVLARRGGGTDMQAGVDYAAADGAEVIVVLTDNETIWRENGPEGVPVILCGINRRGRHTVPTWTRLVDVESEKEQAHDPYGW